MSQAGRNNSSVRNDNGDSESATIPQTDAPEKALTFFAMRLALIEKISTGLGTLGFVWATVVLLGGFAITLDTTDFWFITVILVIEGARIFSRSHELEWQHQATWFDAGAIPPPSGTSIQHDAPSSSCTRDNADAIPPSSCKSIQHDPPSSSSKSIQHDAPSSSSKSIQHDTPSSSRKSIQHDAPSSSSKSIQHDAPSSSTTRGNADAITPSGKAIQQEAPSSSSTGDKIAAIAPSSDNAVQLEAPISTTSTTRDEENQLPPVQTQATVSLVQNNGKVWERIKLQASMFFVTKNICKAWYLLQLLFALICVALSLLKLIRHDFGHVEKGDTDKRNRKAALFIYYSLVLAEASLFIMEKGYWELKTRVHKLLENVNGKYGLGEEGMDYTRRFFYDAYSKSINGSIFDSLRMDMVSFAVDLINSNSPNEQLNGARLLRKLSTTSNFSSVTLRKIGVDKFVIERLVEMLNWRNPKEQEIRKSAAAILEQVASQNQNSLRIAEIPGAVESVASLLHSARKSYTSAGDEVCQRGEINEQERIDVQEYNELALKILNKLSRDHDNCAKIGNTRGLLPKIIDFTYTTKDMLKNSEDQKWHITSVKRSLKLVEMLVSSTGITGAKLRKEMSEIVFTVSNVRNILKNGANYPKMQLRGIQVLTKLGLEDDATDYIGGTGGVLKELLNIFLTKPNASETIKQEKLRNAAGDAMAMLTLESKKNCHRVLQLGATQMGDLLSALEDDALCINAARILRNLCIYTDTNNERIKVTLLRVVTTAPTVLNAIQKIEPTESKLREVMAGLALPVFKFMTYKDFNHMLETDRVSGDVFAAALVKILKDHQTPSIEVPRIRRFAIELAIWMMKEWTDYISKFRNVQMEDELKRVIETTTDIENFHLFSGTTGVSRCDKSLDSLADEALGLLLLA